MPNWKALLDEVNAAGSTFDVIRRKYLAKLYEHTKRNVIVYYSGWLQKTDLMRRSPDNFIVHDNDKNGFMATIHQLDRSKGLDLLLRTPGGDTTATESLVNYLRQMFGTDMRTIIPQIAMSAGTMIALSGKEIIMGKHSNIGPIDPQIGSIAAHGVIEEFNRAFCEIKADPAKIPVWQPIIAKYNPTLIGECEKAIDWSSQMVKDWLVTGMFAGDADAVTKADRVVAELGSHELTQSHARHIHIDRAKELGLKIVALEDDNDLQEAVLSVHHACMQTLTATPAIKIIENHQNIGFITTVGSIQFVQQPQ